YYLALIRFFDKEFDSSRVALRKLLVDYPRRFYVNDALQLLTLMDRAENERDLLYEFSGALLFEQMRQPDSTAVKLELLAQGPNRALADIALYRLALLKLRLSDTVTAVGYIDRLENDFPESYYLPYALKAKADVCFSRADDREQARAIYRRLLEEYPNYPFISEVREIIRALEGEA
ncbi:MAG: tetratricopeptide repeat protein, partial [Candidatus Zixiibacteriota bacterium]